ncbi:MAG: hypothetical protein R3321_10275, partial [Nitrososphaeraceae archaeon]|nr:hypothetical protein [Nitrososphaeraceae archaeon]
MDSFENIAIKNAEKYKKQFSNEGFATSEIEKLNYAYSLEIKDNSRKIKLLIYFSKKGIKPVIQGDRNELYNKVYTIVFGDKFLS